MNIKIYAILIVAMFTFLFACGQSSEVSLTSKPLITQHADVDWTMSCAECHQDVNPAIFKSWSESRHGQVNFGCYICHGDGQEAFYAKGSDQTCNGCHAGQEVNFEKTNIKSCFDCHNGHTLNFHD